MRLENERIGSGKARVDSDSPVVILNIALQASHSFANGSSALGPIDSQKVQLKAQESVIRVAQLLRSLRGNASFQTKNHRSCNKIDQGDEAEAGGE